MEKYRHQNFKILGNMKPKSVPHQTGSRNVQVWKSGKVKSQEISEIAVLSQQRISENFHAEIILAKIVLKLKKDEILNGLTQANWADETVGVFVATCVQD